MSRNTKIVLIIAGSLLFLTIIVVGVGVYLLAEKGKAWAESSVAVMRAGETFGRQTDNQGCVDEAVARMKETPGLTEGFKRAIDNNLFLTGCLNTSRPTPDFCAGVPPPGEIMASARWRAERCRAAGVQQDTFSYCGNLFGIVQTHCEGRRSAPDAAK